MKYKSVLDLIEEQLSEQGHSSYRASFTQDRASFNLPPEMLPLTKGQQDTFNKPVGGEEPSDKQSPPNKDQYKDNNKQISLPSSSTIQQAAYWPTKQYLVVSFKSGATYSYDKVGLEVVVRWEQAHSAGSFFYYQIRKSYPYRRIG